MNSKVWKSCYIDELCKEIPSLFSIVLKIFETCFFFDLLLTFNFSGKSVKKTAFYTNKSLVSDIISSIFSISNIIHIIGVI